MKILFNQAVPMVNNTISTLDSFGIAQCYLKSLLFEKDYKNTTLKIHHHTNFEIHIIVKGCQTYEVSEKTINVKQGQFLLISPLARHKVLHTEPDTEKVSITFNAVKGKVLDSSLKISKDFVFGETPFEITDNISYIMSEKRHRQEYYYQLTENRVFECIIHILRLSGLYDILGLKEESSEDARISIVKQYIKDNISKNISVQDVANYCNLSVKQITRIFKENEGTGVAEYVRKVKVSYIEKMLAEKDLSLKEISEITGFNNEYYFNTFVKNNLGMTPGEYKKTLSGR